MRAAIFTAAAFGSAILCAAAQAAPPKLPATVAGDLKELATLCTDSGGKAMTADAVRVADLNGDGRDDYVFYVGWIVCDGAASAYGDREKGVQVYVGDGAGGASKAFSDAAYDARIEGSGKAARLWLAVSGAMCGKKPGATFAQESFCERPIAWTPKAAKFDYAPVSSVKMIE
jgi:hypothetical protein